MSAAVDDVHHRNGENVCVTSADIAVERHVEIVGGSLSCSKRNAEDGVGAEVGFRGSAVEVEHDLVNADLIEGAVTAESVGDRAVYIGHCFLNALAHIARFVAVAELESLVLACGCTGGNGCASHNAAFEDYIYFNCRVAA